MENLLSFENKVELDLVRFSQMHFDSYKSWFSDNRIREELGGIDNEWLKYILNDESGREYALVSGEELFGVVGIVLPTETQPYAVITNIAIKPRLVGRGLGSLLLQKLFAKCSMKDGQYWLTFVKRSNQVGQHFFMKNEWILGTTQDKEDDYLAFVKK